MTVSNNHSLTYIFTKTKGQNVHILISVHVISSPLQVEHPAADDVDSKLYAAMREELINSVEEIRRGLEQVSNYFIVKNLHL